MYCAVWLSSFTRTILLTFSSCFLSCDSSPRPLNPPSSLCSVSAGSPTALPADGAAQRLQPHGEAGGQRLPGAHRPVLLHLNPGHGRGTRGMKWVIHEIISLHHFSPLSTYRYFYFYTHWQVWPHSTTGRNTIHRYAKPGWLEKCGK